MTIIYRTTDAAKWGSGLGANLSADQVDNNFYELRQAIDNVVAKDGVGISSAAIAGDKLTFTLTDGMILGPLTLPVVKMAARGDWRPNTLYAVDDIVSFNSSVYLISTAHTSAAVFDANANDGKGGVYYSALFSIPGNALPIGGAVGQVLTKASANDFVTGWENTRYVPTGGSTGQVLAKKTATNNDLEWQTVAGTIPTGGAAGQVLTKNSAADFDAYWAAQTQSVKVTTINATTASTSFSPDYDVAVVTAFIDSAITVSGPTTAPRLTVVVTASGGARNITFAAPRFISAGALAVTSGATMSISFISDGSRYVETSRTTALA